MSEGQHLDTLSDGPSIKNVSDGVTQSKTSDDPKSQGHRGNRGTSRVDSRDNDRGNRTANQERLDRRGKHTSAGEGHRLNDDRFNQRKGNHRQMGKTSDNVGSRDHRDNRSEEA